MEEGGRSYLQVGLEDGYYDHPQAAQALVVPPCLQLDAGERLVIAEEEEVEDHDHLRLEHDEFHWEVA